MSQLLTTFRSLVDPLRSSQAAERWIASLPSEALAIQKKVLDVVSRFSGAADTGPGQVNALLKVDARLEPVLAELTREYTANYDKSTEIELRMWHSVFDLVKVFVTAYQGALHAGYTHADEKRWRAVLPWVLVRLAYYRGLDGKFRLFRYSRWTPAQWREFHELYEFARTCDWHREQLMSGAGTFVRAGVCVEQEYIKTLLLMRLDSGTFTADQVEWIALQLEDWAPALSLAPAPGKDAGFFVDLTAAQGLRRNDHTHDDGRVLFLDAAPVYARIVDRMRWLSEAEDTVTPGTPSSREQRLLLMRLAALFGPETLAVTPRAARFEIDSDVRVVIGLQALCEAIVESDESRDAVDEASITREVAEIAAAVAGPDSLIRRVAGTMWRMADTSATGCRLTAPVKGISVRLGEILALRDSDAWSLAIVRRMQRNEADQLTLGVEIIARRFTRVLVRAWSATATQTMGEDQPFYALYLPTHPENRRAPQRSLIGPEERFFTSGMVDLETGSARYLVRFTQTLERQNGWTWALFNAVRKLTP